MRETPSENPMIRPIQDREPERHTGDVPGGSGDRDERIARLLDGSGGPLRGDDTHDRHAVGRAEDSTSPQAPTNLGEREALGDHDRDGERPPVAEGDLERVSIATPYGEARQSGDRASLELRERVERGNLVYRQGVLGVQQGPEAQFWSGTHPLLDTRFADQYGLPAGNTHQAGYRFFVAAGTLGADADYVTRPAPGIGGNAGGAPELVVTPGDVSMRWFHMPDDE